MGEILGDFCFVGVSSVKVAYLCKDQLRFQAVILLVHDIGGVDRGVLASNLAIFTLIRFLPRGVFLDFTGIRLPIGGEIRLLNIVEALDKLLLAHILISHDPLQQIL